MPPQFLPTEICTTMRYFGGKARTCHRIAAFLDACGAKRTSYVEPFVGGAWVTAKVTKRPAIASDACEDLICLYKALQTGWQPPTRLSKEEHAQLKTAPPSALRAFAGFGCSFAGKWFGGYAASGTRNYALNAHNSLLAKVPGLVGVAFAHKDYREVEADNALIYCDPPYAGTTQYGAVGCFNSTYFWDVVRQWSRNNTVIVSEYEAPQDFECVLELPTRTDIRGTNGQIARIEKLFQLRG